MTSQILKIVANMEGMNHPENKYDAFGSAIPLGGGVFLTAAHVFDEVRVNDPTNMTDPPSDEYVGHNGYIRAGSDLPPITAIHLSSQYVAAASTPKENPDVANNDLAYIVDPGAAGSAQASPLVVFADQNAAASFFYKRQSCRCERVSDGYLWDHQRACPRSGSVRDRLQQGHQTG